MVYESVLVALRELALVAGEEIRPGGEEFQLVTRLNEVIKRFEDSVPTPDTLVHL